MKARDVAIGQNKRLRDDIDTIIHEARGSGLSIHDVILRLAAEVNELRGEHVAAALRKVRPEALDRLIRLATGERDERERRQHPRGGTPCR